MIPEGDPSVILERVIEELLSCKAWYLPDEVKIRDRRFGNLLETKYFCYDDDVATWSRILNKYFVRLKWLPKRKGYSSTRSFNRAWEYFAELLAVVKENKHPEFDIYYEMAIKNGMSTAVLEKKLKEFSEI